MNQSPKLESLWIEETRRSAAGIRSKNRILKRSKKAVGGLFHKLDLTDSPKKSPELMISTPYGFDHIAHMDAESSFGLDECFQHVAPDFLAQVAKSTGMDSGTAVDTKETASKRVSCIEQPNGKSISAYSSFRTTAAPVNLASPGSPVSMNKRHSRTQSNASTTFSASGAGAVSRSSSVFTASTSVTSSPTRETPTKRKSGFICRPVGNGPEYLYSKKDSTILAPIPQEDEGLHASNAARFSTGTNSTNTTSIATPTSQSRMSLMSGSQFSYSSTEPPRTLDGFALLQGFSAEEKLNYMKRKQAEGQPTVAELYPAGDDALDEEEAGASDSEDEDDIRLHKFALNMSSVPSVPAEAEEDEEEEAEEDAEVVDALEEADATEQVATKVTFTPGHSHTGSLVSVKATPNLNAAKRASLMPVTDFFGDLGLENGNLLDGDDLDQAFESMVMT